jgi:UDP-3-O-[3-hydroxymyristoyl] N-acetylglucosamine deacetylase
MQQTLKNELKISGIGLHSGCQSNLVIAPADENSGISFVRSDLENGIEIPALFSFVADTRNCTCLGKNGQIVSTIEHIMASLYAFGIDNALIKVDNPEVPILDGSAKVFCDSLKSVEIVKQSSKRKYLRVKKDIMFKDDKGNFVCLKPADEFKVKFEIDFPSKIVGHQEFSGVITKELFVNNIAPARTFCEKYQVDYLKSIGLIKGGSLENAVVLDGETILNDGGFRMKNECVIHKVLDLVGGMYTSGYRLLAESVGFRSGHYHNNEVLKKLFSDKDNFEIVEE